MLVLQSIGYFILAGIFEIGGGYLIWQWLRGGHSVAYAIAGAIVLILYGVVPTLQPEGSFGRVYAAYGGVFIIMSVLWGWGVDGLRPDMYEVVGSIVALVGVAIIMYAPR